MKRRFAFDDTPAGRQAFRLVWDAVLNRGNPEQGQRQSKDDHRSEARIVRALKAISEPHPDAPLPPEDAPDLRMRRLRAGGGTLTLEQPDYKRLCEYVERAQWTAGLTDVIADLEDALDAAEKVEDIEPPAPLRSPTALTHKRDREAS